MTLPLFKGGLFFRIILDDSSKVTRYGCCDYSKIIDGSQ